MKSTEFATEQLCLACGICCNGTLFRDVELQRSDDAVKLEICGLRLERARGKTRFPQPCAALAPGNHCRLYADRPQHCRDFECALFKAVVEDQVDAQASLRTIRKALQLAGRVRTLLRRLGDPDEALALSLRFQRTRRRLEAGLPDEKTAAAFADLTLAFHDLNLVLRQDFFP